MAGGFSNGFSNGFDIAAALAKLAADRWPKQRIT
jgi:hypothetical protein